MNDFAAVIIRFAWDAQVDVSASIHVPGEDKPVGHITACAIKRNPRKWTKESFLEICDEKSEEFVNAV